MVHLKDGWFVIGGGRNGIEYNVLLVAAISSILLYNHSSKRQVQNNKSEAA